MCRLLKPLGCVYSAHSSKVPRTLMRRSNGAPHHDLIVEGFIVCPVILAGSRAARRHHPSSGSLSVQAASLDRLDYAGEFDTQRRSSWVLAITYCADVSQFDACAVVASTAV